MAHELILRDHRAVQHAVARTTAAGAAAGLIHVVADGGPLELLGLLAIGLAAVPPRSLRSAATALLFAALGSGAALGVGWPAAAAMLLFWAMIYARDVQGLPRKLASLAGGGLALWL